MPLSTSPEAEHAFRYDPPAWARLIWESPRVGGFAGDAAALPDAATIKRDTDLVPSANEDAVAPVLFCIEDDLPSVDELWTGRISVAVFLLAVVWFGGQVLLTVAEWL